MANDIMKYYFTRDKRKKINFCRTYRMEEGVEERDFNKKWNDPKLRHFLHKNSDLTSIFFKSLAQRIQNKSNFVIVLYGMPNSGKSEGGQTISFQWVKLFKALKTKMPRIFMAFSNSEFDKILPMAKEGDVILRDESPKEVGQGSHNMKAQIDNITKIVRAKQISFVFISPEIIRAKVVNYYLEACGKCKERRETRYILYNNDLKPLGHVILKLHNNNEFRKEYERIKNKNIETLLAHGGTVTGHIDGDKLEKDANMLVNFASFWDTHRISELKTLWTLYNTEKFKQQRPDLMIKGDTNYINQVVSLASMYIKTGKDLKKKKRVEKEKKEHEEPRTVVYKNDMSFPTYIFNNLKGEEAIIGMSIARGDSNRVIEQNYPQQLTKGKIQTLGKKLRHQGRHNQGLGYLFEEFVALNHYKIPKKDLKIACRGGEKDDNGNSCPDIEYKGILATVKIRFDPTKTLKFYQHLDFAPEYNRAKELGRKYDLIFLNPVWYQKIMVFTIDPNDDDVVVVKKIEDKKMKKLIM